MSKIDDLITAAQRSVDESSEEDKPGAQQYLKALQDAKAANITLSQDEVNNIVASEREKATSGWKDALGMDLEEAQEILGDMNDEELASLLPSESEGEEEEGESFADRVRNALSQRDQTISGLQQNQSEFQRKYYDERIQNRIAEGLRAEGLQDAYLAPAKRLSDYSSLVDQAMNGEEPTPQKISEIVGSIKEMSPVWFQAEDSGDSRQSVGDTGLRLKEGVGIPPTPNGDTSNDGPTHEQRLSASGSPFRRGG